MLFSERQADSYCLTVGTSNLESDHLDYTSHSYSQSSSAVITTCGYITEVYNKNTES